MDQKAKEQLMCAAAAIETAVRIIRKEKVTIDAFLEECRKMESFGHILDPTLYRDPERQAVSAVVEPVFKAATQFLKSYDAQQARAFDALTKVGSGRQ